MCRGVAAVGDFELGTRAPHPRLGQRDLVIDAERQELLLPREPVLETPKLRAARLHQEVEAFTIEHLVGTVARLRRAHLLLVQRRHWGYPDPFSVVVVGVLLREVPPFSLGRR